jgi:hypothetical protein
MQDRAKILKNIEIGGMIGKIGVATGFSFP